MESSQSATIYDYGVELFLKNGENVLIRKDYDSEEPFLIEHDKIVKDEYLF